MWQINLIPEELKQKHRSSMIMQSFLITIVVTAVLISVVHFALSFGIAKLEGKPFGFKDAFVDKELADLKAQFNQLKSEKDNLYKSQGPLIEVMLFRFPYADILKAIANSASEKVWFDDIRLNSKDNMCHLNGRSFTTRMVSEFMLELKKLPYFKDLALTHMEKSQKRSDLFEFKIECEFN